MADHKFHGIRSAYIEYLETKMRRITAILAPIIMISSLSTETVLLGFVVEPTPWEFKSRQHSL